MIHVWVCHRMNTTYSQLDVEQIIIQLRLSLYILIYYTTNVPNKAMIVLAEVVNSSGSQRRASMLEIFYIFQPSLLIL